MRRVETFFIVIAIAFYAWFLTHYGPRPGDRLRADGGMGPGGDDFARGALPNREYARLAGHDRGLSARAQVHRTVRGANWRRGGRLRDAVGAAGRPIRDGGGCARETAHADRARDGRRRVAGRGDRANRLHFDRAGHFAAHDTGGGAPVLGDRRRLCAGGGAGGRLLLRADEAAVLASVARRGQVRYRPNQHQRRRNPRLRRGGRRGPARFLRAASRPLRRVVPLLCDRVESRPARNLYPAAAAASAGHRCRPRCWSSRSGC